MKAPFRVQLAGFAAAVILVGGLIFYAQQSSWRQLEGLGEKYRALHLASFHSADRVRSSILGLNDNLVRFESREKPADRARFRQESRALKSWMSTNAPSLTTARERELMKQVQAAFAIYVDHAEELLEESARNPGSDLSSVLSMFEKTEKESTQLFALCGQLGDAHREALGAFLGESQLAIERLERLMLVRLLVSLALGLTLAVLIYRGMIAPLRTQLIESHTIIERQGKLSALGALAAGVAHELRNPLTAINVRLHSLGHSVQSDPSAVEDVTVIAQEIKRLDRIVRDFLHFARPSDPQFSVVPADSLLRELHGLLQAQLEKSGIELQLDLRTAESVRVDPQQIKQVLINLVRNGAESMAGPGVITLRTRTETVALHGHSTRSVILEVSDTGQGIPTEVRKHLFDPFFSTKEGGTGLGLAMAVRIVKKHNGTLVYHTELNRGTTFGVVLPPTPSDEA